VTRSGPLTYRAHIQ